MNHYVNIEITGYRVQYCESIADRGVVRFISWLGTVEPVDCFNKVIDCSPDLTSLFDLNFIILSTWLYN